jgi:hypothetical protein
MKTQPVEDVVSFLKEWEDSTGDIIEVVVNDNEPMFDDMGNLVEQCVYTEYHLGHSSGYVGVLSVWKSKKTDTVLEADFMEYENDDYNY